MNNFIEIGRIAPRLHTAAHLHTDDWEIVTYIEGIGVTTIEGAEHRFSPGTVVCIPPGHRHDDRSDTPYRSIWIRFRRGPRTQHGPVIFNEPVHAPLTRLADLICRDFTGTDARDMAFCDTLLDALIAYISAHHGRSSMHPLVETVCRTITAHVNDMDFKVRDALKDHQLSPFHLSRLFTRETGTSPRQYLLALRIREAAALLAMGGVTVREAAREFGFRDPYHFSRLFKQRMGVSPKRYRSAQVPATSV
ncbi:MAG: AraC family transcriptional regulator [Spirochaetes bacterium]|nr:AraC family transcriptional regulator [Spirochaetota bacterium]